MNLIRTSLITKLDRIGENIGSGALTPCRNLAGPQRGGLGTICGQGKPPRWQRREDDVAPPSYILITWMLRVAIIAVAGMSNACATASLASLEGTWRLVSIDSKPLRQLPADQVPYFTITGMTVSGFDGCNSFDGRIDQPGNISSTRRGCLEDTIKLPLDLGDLLPHLQAGTIEKNSLSVPPRDQFPSSMFERSNKSAAPEYDRTADKL